MPRAIGDGGVMNSQDTAFLRRAVELAAEALEAGDEPFGSVLVAGDGEVLAEDRNRDTTSGDPTYHPEIVLARWAAARLDPQQRGEATLYTSGEHCPMCSAAHGIVGLGRIVYVAASDQFRQWRDELGVAHGPVAPIPIREVVPGATVEGPVPELNDQVRELYRRFLQQQR